MARLRVLSGREVCRILTTHGVAEVSRRGSNVVMQMAQAGQTTAVSVPDHLEFHIGTPLSIIRQAGLRRADFE